MWNAHDEDEDHDHEGEDHDHEGEDEETSLAHEDGDEEDHDHDHEHGDDDDCTDEGTCLFNSAAITELKLGKASGSFWGAETTDHQYRALSGPNEKI